MFYDAEHFFDGYKRNAEYALATLKAAQEAGKAGQTQAALGVADLASGSGDVLGGVMRFDDSVVGPGYGLVLGGGTSLGGPTSLRVLGTRFLGDRDYRAWRLKAGPLWSLPGGGSLGLYYVHDENNRSPDTESGAGELGVPLAAGWSGKLAGSYGRAEDVTGYSAAVGAGWTAIPHLELGADVGIARNPPATASPGPNGGGLLGPLLGEDPASPPARVDRVAATTSLSLRVTFP